MNYLTLEIMQAAVFCAGAVKCMGVKMQSTNELGIARGNWGRSVRVTSVLFLGFGTFGYLQANHIYLLEQLHIQFHMPYYMAVIVNLIVCLTGAFGIELLIRTCLRACLRAGLVHRSVEEPIAAPTVHVMGNVAVGTGETDLYRLVSANLNTRVMNLQKRATAMYWSILIIIGAGVWIIIFSGYLSSWDTVGAGIWSRIDSEQATLDNSVVKRASDELDHDKGETDKNTAIGTIFNNLVDNRDRDITEQRDKLLAALIDDMQTRTRAGQNVNLSGTILRISIIGLIVFLVQILIQLYRYTSRLMAFYSSRRDALILAKGELKEGAAFAELLLPTGLDFGREPNHPLYEAARFLFNRGARVRTSEDPVRSKARDKKSGPKIQAAAATPLNDQGDHLETRAA